MAATRWQRLQDLFDAASRLQPAERSAFLDGCCADEPALRREVESLLRADDESSGFVLGPLGGVAAAVADPPLAQTRIGAYQVTGELGRGGMGAVYRAVRADDAFRKEVAIKVIRGGADDAEARRRFLAERQILATLDHPHIARLLDGGATDDGRPYVVMELVEGEPLDRFCDARALALDRRLRLFLDVCAAVESAHRNLVVHRDLKPGNILVTADGRPKLLDFGIAKLLDASAGTGGTATLMRAMTPAYASPEQVRGGSITTASDVYALGMILYELLAGEPPYRLESATGAEVERIVCERQPERPSVKAAGAADAVARARSLTPDRLRRRLAGDLDTIVLQALRKEPERRYASVEQLAEDVRRHLDGRPVRARADTFGYRASRFVRRHRTGVAALIALAALTAFYTARLARERDRARLEAVKATQVAEFLQALFRVSNPDESRGRPISVREMLDRGAARIGRDLAEQPEAQADLMALIGDVYLQLGLYAEATAQLDAALATRQRIGRGEDAAAADILQALSAVKKVAADYAAADALAGQAVALRRRLRGPPADLAASLNAQAEARRVLGDYAAAEALSREALALRRGALPPEHRDIADNLNNLALLIHARGDYAAAEAMHRESLAMRRRILGEDHPEFSNSLNNLAVTLAARGDYAAAEPLFREALALRRRILGEDEPRTLNTRRNLGALLLEKGEETAAEDVLRETLGRIGRRLDPDHPYAADARMSLALALSARGAHAAAVESASAALAAHRRVQGERHPETLRAMARLARVSRAAGDDAAAGRWFRLAIEGQRAVLLPGHPATVETLAGLGALLAARGDPAAEPTLREAMALAAERLLPSHAGRAEAALALGALLAAQGRRVEAEPLLVAGWEGLRASHGPGHRSTLVARRRLDALRSP